MLTVGRFARRVGIVTLDHQLDMVEAHVGTTPILRLHSQATLGRACWLKGIGRLEVRLADVTCAVPRLGEGAGIARLACRVREVDSVVRHSVGARQETGEDRGAGRLAHQVRRDAGREAAPLGGQHVEMRRLHPAPFEAVAVGALLVGGDE
jgi:hypothetical protein